MNTIDLSPLYRNSVGFDRFGSLLDSALRTEQAQTGYPPYNIEVTGENEYSICLALAGFKKNELNIQVDGGVLTVSGKKEKVAADAKYLHQGIAFRSFERKFNLAEHVKVIGAELNDGLLNVKIEKELPERLKPRVISILDTNESTQNVIDGAESKNEAA